METNTASLLITLADNHPGILTLLITIATIIIILASIGVAFAAKAIWKSVKGAKIKTKIGDIELGKEDDSTEAVKNENIAASHKYDEQFFRCLTQVVKISVESGFDRSIKRQELFNRQLAYANLRYENIMGELKSEYIDKCGSSNIKVIDLLLHYLFNGCAVRSLEKVFKADRLIEKSKEAIVEANRHIIDSASSSIIFKAHELSASKFSADGLSLSLVDETFIKIITNKTNEIKKATTDIIENAYDFAVEEMDNMSQIHSDLAERINTVLVTYLGKVDNLPNHWNDDLPPNDIIGDI